MRTTLLGRTPKRTQKQTSPRTPRGGARRKWASTALALGALAISGADFATHTPASNRTDVVTVAKSNLVAGTMLEPGDLDKLQLEVSKQASPAPASSPSALLGRVLLVPVSAGQEITPADTAAPAAGKAKRQISFALPASHALSGSLVVGDRVDVLATSGTGNAATTVVLGRSLVVTAVGEPKGGLSSATNPAISVTLACPDSETALKLANGAAGQTLWLDLANGAAKPDDPGVYQLNFSG